MALITSLNEFKLSHWQTSEMWMLRGLCGETLSFGLGFLTPSFWTTDFNLIVRLPEGTVVNWVSRMGIQLQLTTKGNGQAEAVNKVIVNGLKKSWMMPRVNG